MPTEPHQLAPNTKEQSQEKGSAMAYRLQTKVTEQMFLNSGTLEETTDTENNRFRMITPAPRTMYQQVVDSFWGPGRSRT